MFIDIIVAQKDFKPTAIISSTKDFLIAQLKYFKDKFVIKDIKINYKTQHLILIEYEEMFVFINLPYSYPDKDLKSFNDEVFAFGRIVIDEKIMQKFAELKKNLP